MKVVKVLVVAAVVLASVSAWAKVGDVNFIQPPEARLRAFASASAPEVGAALKRNAEVTILDMKAPWVQVEERASKLKGWIKVNMLSTRKVETVVSNPEGRRLGTSSEFTSTAGSRAIGDMGTYMRSKGQVSEADTKAVDYVTEFRFAGDPKAFAAEGGLEYLGQEVQ